MASSNNSSVPFRSTHSPVVVQDTSPSHDSKTQTRSDSPLDTEMAHAIANMAPSSSPSVPFVVVRDTTHDSKRKTLSQLHSDNPRYSEMEKQPHAISVKFPERTSPGHTSPEPRPTTSQGHTTQRPSRTTGIKPYVLIKGIRSLRPDILLEVIEKRGPSAAIDSEQQPTLKLKPQETKFERRSFLERMLYGKTSQEPAPDEITPRIVINGLTLRLRPVIFLEVIKKPEPMAPDFTQSEESIAKPSVDDDSLSDTSSEFNPSDDEEKNKKNKMPAKEPSRTSVMSKFKLRFQKDKG